MTNTIKILVFGTTPSCARCLQAEKEAKGAAGRFPAGSVVVEKHDALSETGRKYGVIMTPTVIVAEKKVAVGRVLAEDDLVELLKKETGYRPWW